MPSRQLVDPELLPLLDSFPPLSLSRESLPGVRAAMDEQTPPLLWGEADSEVDVAAVTVPGPAGAPDVRVLLYRPRADANGAALLHIHGGGYVLGTADRSDPANRAIARALGCVVASVDYRLAPETVFPGAVEDCYAALVWLKESADTLGIDAGRIGIMGESAGGGLAAGLALLARDRKGPPIAFQHLIFPMLDDRTCLRADQSPCIGEFIWTPRENRFGWESLLGQAPGGADVSPYAAAARAETLAGLPPAFLAVGALDLFLAEDLAYAQRLGEAGVPVELHVYPGAYHAFQMAVDAAVTRRANTDSLGALRRFMAVSAA